eukprot:m.35323 g.35323  ORF g.35323 m.35323 type:complete len:229 (+) comp12383_c0_seq1:161-847(+)
MEDIIASTENHEFAVVKAIESQQIPWMLPFKDMDKSSEDQCLESAYGRCTRGPLCPYRHIKGNKGMVCNFWLRGICKKGDDCEFLHLYIEQLMPECYFFQQNHVCNKEDCKFKHVTDADRVKECAWYARGFCRNGPNCPFKHTKARICQNYLCGHCPDGFECSLAHPRWEIPNSSCIDPKTGLPETRHNQSPWRLDVPIGNMPPPGMRPPMMQRGGFRGPPQGFPPFG